MRWWWDGVPQGEQSPPSVQGPVLFLGAGWQKGPERDENPYLARALLEVLR